MAQYISIRYIDVDGVTLRQSYNIPNGYDAAQILTLAQECAERCFALTQCGIIEVGTYQIFDQSGWAVTGIADPGSSVNDEMLGIYTVAENDNPERYYIPSVRDDVRGTGGTVNQTAEVTAFATALVNPGTGVDLLRLGDNLGSPNDAMRRFRLKRANKRRSSRTT